MIEWDMQATLVIGWDMQPGWGRAGRGKTLLLLWAILVAIPNLHKLELHSQVVDLRDTWNHLIRNIML